MTPALRVATTEDLPTCVQILVDALNGVLVGRGAAPTFTFEQAWQPAWWEHLLSSTATFVVAEEHGRIVGFGNCLQREDEWFLSHLFVDPAAQSRGVGQTLLEACLAAGSTAHVRALVADAANLVSVPLYARYGLGPTVPLLHLGGTIPATGALLGEPPVVLETVVDEDRTWLDQFDRTVRGHARPVDHAYFRAAGYTLHRCLLAGTTVGYIYTAPWGHIGPGVAGPRSVLGAVMAALEYLRLAGMTTASIMVPGSSTELLAWLLRSGFRHTGMSIYCADHVPGDWSCYVPFRAGLP